MSQASSILAEVKKAVCGKDRVLLWVLTVILARGHILPEDIPGVGKTTYTSTICRCQSRRPGRSGRCGFPFWMDRQPEQTR